MNSTLFCTVKCVKCCLHSSAIIIQETHGAASLWERRHVKKTGDQAQAAFLRGVSPWWDFFLSTGLWAHLHAWYLTLN